MDTKPVLYVEDDDADVFLMERAWRKVRLSHPLYIVGDAQEAAHYLTGTGRFTQRSECPMPALMIMDLKLPRMSRLELLKWIRRQDAIHALRVIVLSSSGLATDIEQAKDLGVSDYWVKQSDPQKLEEMVASLKSVLAALRPLSY